ncbi:lipoyl(octanoyl) transferase LipB [Candidatus Sumerlaeota bacterium]|nr:lipoyl(octanoyl) transferase LipB [Candidatus Sumerlaeota bacterium]
MLDVKQVGLIAYRDGEAMQRDYWERRTRDEIGDTLLLLEHPPVITLGVRKQSADDVLLSPELLHARGIELVKTDRGGLATLHAPGQIVGYFFVRLNGWLGGLRGFINVLQEGLIRCCADFGVNAHPDDTEPGIWVDGGEGESPRKIASLGLSVRRQVSRHGFGLNVNTDLSLFETLNPCGHPSSVMTTLSREAQKELPLEEVMSSLERQFLELFQ